MDERRRVLWRRARQFVTCFDQLLCSYRPFVRVVMYGAKGLSGGDSVPNLFVHNQPNGWIYLVFFSLPTATQYHARNSYLLALDGSNISGSRTANISFVLRLG